MPSHSSPSCLSCCSERPESFWQAYSLLIKPISSFLSFLSFLKTSISVFPSFCLIAYYNMRTSVLGASLYRFLLLQTLSSRSQTLLMSLRICSPCLRCWHSAVAWYSEGYLWIGPKGWSSKITGLHRCKTGIRTGIFLHGLTWMIHCRVRRDIISWIDCLERGF